MTTTFGIDVGGAVLGAVVLEGKIPPDIRPLLTLDLFTGERKVQATAILEANDRLGATDPVTVQDILSRQGQPLDIILDIVRLAEMVPSSAHLAAHVQLLREQDGLPEKGPATWTLLDAADLAGWKVTPLTWMVKSIIAFGRLGALVGLPKTRKGIMALDLALHIVTGREWLDRYRTTACPVLYLAREDHVERIKARIEEIQAGYEMGPLPHGQLLILSRERFALTDDEHLAWLVGQVKAHGIRLIVLDVLGRMVPGMDPMNPRDWSKVMDRLETLNRDLGVTILLVDHARKPPVGQGKAGGTSPLEMKGPIEKYGGMDFIVMVSETTQRGRLEILTEVKDSDERLHFMVDVSREALRQGKGWVQRGPEDHWRTITTPGPKLTWAGDVAALANAATETRDSNRELVFGMFTSPAEMTPADVEKVMAGSLSRTTINRHLRTLAGMVPPRLLRRTDGQNTFYRLPNHGNDDLVFDDYP